MMVHKTGGSRGRYRFDRRFPGVGRIWRSSGARTQKEFDTLDRLLDRLFEAEQLDVLIMIKEGRLTAKTVRQAERRGKLTSDHLAADIALHDRLWDASSESGKPIAGAVSRTLAAMSIAEGSRDRYALSFRQLRDTDVKALQGAATVAALGKVDWSAVWAARSAVSPGDRNRLRAAVSAFLTQYLGGDKFHPFRRQVVRAMGAKEREDAVVSDLSPDEFWTLMEHVPELGVASFATMAASGMRVGEYLQASEARLLKRTEGDLCQIRFANGKQGGGIAYADGAWWPYVKLAVPCRVAKTPTVYTRVQYDARYKRLYAWLAAASATTHIRVTIHYLRHLFVQEGVEAMPSVHVQKAVRHKTAAMTNRYADRSDVGRVARAVGDRLKRKGA